MAGMLLGVCPFGSGQAATPATSQLRLSSKATDVSDRNVKLPPGSYQLTCPVVDMRGNKLKAICQAPNGDWLRTELDNIDRCTGDISSENGKLRCNPNRTGPPSRHLDAFGEGIPGLDQSPWAPMRAAGWQLRHDTWTFKDGAPESIRALAQTSDGFLWIGGTTGLYRFDGRQFELFHSPFGEELLSTNISSLYAPPSGGLWIGYTFGGASFIDKGRVRNYGGEFATSSGSIRLMTQDKDGIVWAAGRSSGLWRFEHSWEHIGTEWNVPIKSSVEVAVDREGNLWAGGEGMLLRLPRGSRRFQIVEENLPLNTQHFGYEGRLVDQEGSIWFGGLKGLDRFVYSPLVKENLPTGAGYGFAFAADNEGAVLIGGWDAGLYRVAQGEMKGLRQYLGWETGFLYRAPDTTIWLGSSKGRFGPSSGVWHETLSYQRPSKKSKQSKASLELSDALWRFTGRDWEVFDLPREVADQGQFLQAITQDRQGRMWVSLGRHGLYTLANGAWKSYGGRQDLPTTGVVCEFTDSLGRVWFGYTKNVLAVLDGDRVQVFGPNDGVRVGNITAIHGRGPKIWIGGEFGLEQFEAGYFKNINAVNNEWLRGISGIVETANGDLWLNGLTGIFHIRQSEVAKALNEASYRVKGDHFGRREGLPGFAAQIRPLPTAIEGTDGRLWFAGSDGVVWLDPARFEHQVTPPPVTIQSVSGDDKTYAATSPLRFPARTSSVQITYTAVSLSNPDAIRFRYKLNEADADWQEVSKPSPITYRNLPPGSYHFSVAASDTNGVWSDKVEHLDFTILPAFYQTTWFRLSCVAAFLALLWALYRLRLRQIARQFNLTLGTRVDERTRIARELHDTLLQSFQGLTLQFQRVRNLLPGRTSEAIQTLDAALDGAEQAIVEGRDAIHDLRSPTAVPKALEEEIKALGEELVAKGADQSESMDFRIVTEGSSRSLRPGPHTEIFRIVREALRNAFSHSQGRLIETELAYTGGLFRIRIRDNGKGIDSDQRLQAERSGHWGLRGMRERAQHLGGELEVWSEPGAGTEIELRIPGSIAYETTTSQSSFWRFWRRERSQ